MCEVYVDASIGRRLRATKDFSAGDFIFSEFPLLCASDDEDNTLTLPSLDQDAAESLHRSAEILADCPLVESLDTARE